MNKLIVVGGIAAAFLISGCGSSPKSTESSADSQMSESSSAEATVAEPEVHSAAPTAPPAPVPVKNQEVARGLLSGISDGIRAQNDEAVYRAATQVLGQNPNEVRALNSMGVYNYRKGRYLAAEYFFTRAIKVQSSSELLNNLALTQLAMGEKRDAIKTWRKALDLNPNDGVAAANVGSIYVQEKDYTKARIVLETATKRGIRDHKTLVNYGVAQAAAGKYDSAKLMYEEALKVNGNSQEALLNYAILLIEHLGQRQEGMQQLDRLRFMSPDETVKKRMNELENKAKSELK